MAPCCPPCALPGPLQYPRGVSLSRLLQVRTVLPEPLVLQNSVRKAAGMQRPSGERGGPWVCRAPREMQLEAELGSPTSRSGFCLFSRPLTWFWASWGPVSPAWPSL